VIIFANVKALMVKIISSVSINSDLFIISAIAIILFSPLPSAFEKR
jgi:hypothetical protein